MLRRWLPVLVPVYFVVGCAVGVLTGRGLWPSPVICWLAVAAVLAPLVGLRFPRDRRLPAGALVLASAAALGTSVIVAAGAATSMRDVCAAQAPGEVAFTASLDARTGMVNCSVGKRRMNITLWQVWRQSRDVTPGAASLPLATGPASVELNFLGMIDPGTDVAAWRAQPSSHPLDAHVAAELAASINASPPQKVADPVCPAPVRSQGAQVQIIFTYPDEKPRWVMVDLSCHLGPLNRDMTKELRDALAAHAPIGAHDWEKRWDDQHRG